MSDKKPYFSEERINEIVKNLRAKVSEHMRKQSEGILPYFSRIPVTIMEVPHVMVVIGRTRNIAAKLLKEIRVELGKKPRQKVSVTEFCEYTNIPLHDVRQALNLLT